MRSLLLWLCLALPASADEFRLAVTTSFENSGLAGELIPAYEAASGDEVRLIVVGTGRALSLGAAGDVDAVLTHAPAAEDKAVEDGDFLRRTEVMYNDFVLLGPADDPAMARSAATAADALARIADAAALFTSRGDDSGTHKAELALWATADRDPGAASGRWYREIGNGMGATLNAAVAMDAYVLSDRASWLTFGNRRDHAILFEGDSALFNQYSFLPTEETPATQRFEAWLTGPGQEVIGAYALEGQKLFIPNAQ
ncbi:MAG: substrate-binding domain-containing protein [Rhodobacteraceae bacterium]|nr:substrate-binding domain-containing protein [Paracoccaceae bacterium]